MRSRRDDGCLRSQRLLARNRTSCRDQGRRDAPEIGVIGYTLADGDDVTVPVRSIEIKPDCGALDLLNHGKPFRITLPQ